LRFCCCLAVLDATTLLARSEEEEEEEGAPPPPPPLVAPVLPSPLFRGGRRLVVAGGGRCENRALAGTPRLSWACCWTLRLLQRPMAAGGGLRTRSGTRTATRRRARENEGSKKTTNGEAAGENNRHDGLNGFGRIRIKTLVTMKRTILYNVNFSRDCDLDTYPTCRGCARRLHNRDQDGRRRALVAAAVVVPAPRTFDYEDRVFRVQGRERRMRRPQRLH
jgi:hypothetical protein